MTNSNPSIKLLKRKNLRVTSSRLELIDIVSDENRALAFSEIQGKMKGSDRVTLYRTIQTLLDHGVLHKALQEGNDTFYALCSANCTTESHNHNHVHFKCLKCGAVKCLEPNEIPTISIPKHTITSIELSVQGYCPECELAV